MSQGQPERPQSGQEHEPITYGDVFGVRGNIASEPIAPGDAAIMQSAEYSVLGYTKIASVMEAASGINVATGAVDPNTVSDAVINQGVTVSQDNIGGTQIVTEKVGGEVVGQYVDPRGAESTLYMDSTTIGEALEATAAEKPVAQVLTDPNKSTFSDVLVDATTKLGEDKKLTSTEDVEGVIDSADNFINTTTPAPRGFNHNA